MIEFKSEPTGEACQEKTNLCVSTVRTRIDTTLRRAFELRPSVRSFSRKTVVTTYTLTELICCLALKVHYGFGKRGETPPLMKEEKEKKTREGTLTLICFECTNVQERKSFSEEMVRLESDINSPI